MSKKIKKSRVLQASGLAAVATAAFVPGAAEAHCGHGMYGQVHWWSYPEGMGGYSGSEDYGCTGKGAQPGYMGCTSYCDGSCCEDYWYYNCYTPC